MGRQIIARLSNGNTTAVLSRAQDRHRSIITCPVRLLLRVPPTSHANFAIAAVWARARDVDRCETNLKLCTESRLETRECMTQLHFHELTGKFSDTSTAERERDKVESAMKLKHGNEIRHSECGRQETEQPRGCAFELSEEEALGPDSGAKICSFESSFESSSDQNSRNLLPKFRYTHAKGAFKGALFCIRITPQCFWVSVL